MGQKHERLREEFNLLFQNEFPQSRIFKRTVGLYYTRTGIPIQIEAAGRADSYAIINIKELLIHLEIEYKIDKDKQSKDQIKWQVLIESLNGIYLVVHNVDLPPVEAIKKLKELLSARIYT